MTTWTTTTSEEVSRPALELVQKFPGGVTSRITVVCEQIQSLTELTSGKAQLRLKDGTLINTAHSYDEVAEIWNHPSASE